MIHDELVRRRITSAQLGLLAALLVMLVGPETLDLSRGLGVQLNVLVTAVLAALSVERVTRHPQPSPRSGRR